MAEEVSRNFGIFRGRASGVKVAIKDNPPRVYVYEDENLRLEVPVPTLEVFVAFVRELDKLGAEDADAEKYVTILARAFWLLHQRPKVTGILWWRQTAAPKVDEREARALLEREVRSVEVALVSLTSALFGFVNYVMGGGRADGEPRDYQARIEP